MVNEAALPLPPLVIYRFDDFLIWRFRAWSKSVSVAAGNMLTLRPHALNQQIAKSPNRQMFMGVQKKVQREESC